LPALVAIAVRASPGLAPYSLAATARRLAAASLQDLRTPVAPAQTP